MRFSKLLSGKAITNHLIMEFLSIDDRIAVFPGFRSCLRHIRTAYTDRISVCCVSSTGHRSGVPPNYTIIHLIIIAIVLTNKALSLIVCSEQNS